MRKARPAIPLWNEEILRHAGPLDRRRERPATAATQDGATAAALAETAAHSSRVTAPTCAVLSMLAAPA